jgi:two-component system sensor histidine kinase RpfC
MVGPAPGGRVLLVPAGALPAAEEAGLREGASGMPVVMLLREEDEAGLPPLAARRGAFAGVSPTRLRRELPAALSALMTARQPANDDDAPPIRRRAQGRRILVVDDNRVNRMVISRMLEAGGHQVSLASQGEEALDRLDQENFDLVAMDLNMPVMDGIEATKIYRMTSLDRPHLPIVALTADATDYARQRAMDAGMDACLTKPVDAVALLDLIDQLVAGKVPAVARPPLPAAVPPAPAAPQGGVLNLRMLEDLLLLGGSEFVGEVIATFIAESGRHLRDLYQHAGELDAQRFHDTLHALRSVAANVGAVVLAERCGVWQSAGLELLRQDGAAMMSALDNEVQAARAALLRWQSPPPQLVSRSG